MEAGQTPAELRRAAVREGRRRVAYAVVGLVVLLALVDWFSAGVTRGLVYGTATLDVITEPPGASVAIDAEPQGATPLSLRVLPGAHVLYVTHPYHPEVLEHLRLERGANVTRTFTLAPAYGRLQVVSNPRNARVSIDGEAQAERTPLVLDRIRAGKHRLRVELPARRAVEPEVEVLPGELTEISVELEPVPMGSLTVQVEPADARVTIDGVEEPYRPGVELPVDDYVVRVERSGYAPVSHTVRVRPGANIETVALDRQFGVLSLTVRPAGAEVTVRHGTGSLARSERWTRGMRLPAGPIVVEARAPGYRNRRRSLTLAASGASLTIALEKLDARAGDRLQDRLASGESGPALVVAPGGTFRMGDASGHGAENEQPPHDVTLSQPYAIGMFEVTRDDFARFASANGRTMPQLREGETGTFPLVGIDWEDAMDYTMWLSKETGNTYRLPTEPEWEHAARAGAERRYPAGDAPESVCTHGNVADRSAALRFREWATADCDDGFVRAAPVGRLEPNAFGLYDVLGNVAEWTLDCWHRSFDGAPSDGRAWIEPDCVGRVVRGGSWDTGPDGVTLSARAPAGSPADDRGFRVVREL